MKYLKNNLKVIIAFLLGAMLTGGVAYAVISAQDVTYTKEGTEIKNVGEALNDLYNKSELPKQFKILKMESFSDTNNDNAFLWMYLDVQKYSKITFTFSGSNVVYSVISIAKTDNNCTQKNSSWDYTATDTLLKTNTPGTYTVNLTNVNFIEIFDHNYRNGYHHEILNWILE